MARYIDIDKLENYCLDCIHNIRRECEGNCVKCYYNNGGAEDVAPVIHAKWILTLYGWRCSACEELSVHNKNYCPNCGAKMK